MVCRGPFEGSVSNRYGRRILLLFLAAQKIISGWQMKGTPLAPITSVPNERWLGAVIKYCSR